MPDDSDRYEFGDNEEILVRSFTHEILLIQLLKSIINTKNSDEERSNFEKELRRNFSEINEHLNNEDSARDRAWKEEMNRIFAGVVDTAFEEAASKTK